jgi:hypothetical protein
MPLALIRLNFINAITAFTHSFGFPCLDHLQAKESTYMDTFQGLNLNHQCISGLEPEMAVTELTKYHRLKWYLRQT